MIKKTAFLIMILIIFYYCVPKQEKVEKFIEDGVEVIINHLDPYHVKNGHTIFTLEEECVIDTERDDLSVIGLADITTFDIDSEGSIYLLSPKSGENLIYKFDRNGNFLTSFGRKGQGPGELQNPSSLIITSKDEVAITDTTNHKLSRFSKDGNLIEEISISSDIQVATPLANGKYIALVRKIGVNVKYFEFPLILYSSEFEEIKELDRMKYGNPIIGKSLKGTYHTLTWSISKGKIYTGVQDRGYEIYVYDLNGNLIRKIKREYKPVAVSDDYKNEYMKSFDDPIFESIRKKIYFPDSMPPFHSFFTDDEGKLFVMTYEEGENPGEYIYDIFNAAGIFIGRRNLKIFYNTFSIYAKIKNRRFYCFNEKETGYKELMVYKMKWE